MKASEVSKRILEGISHELMGYSFKLNKRAKEFVKEENGVYQIFDLYFNKDGNSIKIRPEIRVKIKEIEDIYKSITKVDERPFLTLGNHLFEINRYLEKGEEINRSEEAAKRWLVEDEDDIAKLIKLIPEYFKEIAIPYYGLTNTVSKADALLNKYPREISIHNGLYPLRANIALIAAKINNNSNLSELIEIYKEELAEAEETYLADFKAIELLFSEG